jgi:hypothetical protein
MHSCKSQRTVRSLSGCVLNYDYGLSSPFSLLSNLNGSMRKFPQEKYEFENRKAKNNTAVFASADEKSEMGAIEGWSHT